jgi:hypothetical protein
MTRLLFQVHLSGVLTLTIEPFRVNWQVDAPMEFASDDTGSSVPHLGAFPECIDRFRALFKNWLSGSPPLSRLAFGCILIEPVEARVAGYQRLAQLLRSAKLDVSGEMSDFAFQINRPRLTQVGPQGMKINRLVRWSVMQRSRVRFSLRNPSAQAVTEDAVASAVRLEQDINTAADHHEPFEVSTLHKLFDELVTQSIEIAERGDIA